MGRFVFAGVGRPTYRGYLAHMIIKKKRGYLITQGENTPSLEANRDRVITSLQIAQIVIIVV